MWPQPPKTQRVRWPWPPWGCGCSPERCCIAGLPASLTDPGDACLSGLTGLRKAVPLRSEDVANNIWVCLVYCLLLSHMDHYCQTYYNSPVLKKNVLSL